MAGRPKIGNVAALALGLLVGLALLELGIRWRFRPPPPHPPVESNAGGFRDTEHALDKPEGVVRIAFIGDSYTFGQGVEPSERFSERVAAALDETWDEVRVEMLNFGRPGASTADVLRIYEGGVVHYDPDLVVYSFVLNDFSTPARDAAFRDERDRILEEHRDRFPGLRWASSHLRTAAVLDRLLFDTTSGIEPAQLEFLRSLYAPGPDLDFMRSQLRQLTLRMSRENLLGLVVLMPYFLPQEADLDFYRRAGEIVADAAQRPRLEYLEVLPTLADRPFHEWWVSVADHHPNAAAHARMASLMTERILAVTGPRWSRFEARRSAAAPGSVGKQPPPTAGIVPPIVRSPTPRPADPN